MRGERQFMRPSGRPQQSFFSDRNVITPFPKRVVVSNGAECALGNIENWFKELSNYQQQQHPQFYHFYFRSAMSWCYGRPTEKRRPMCFKSVDLCNEKSSHVVLVALS
ncbi:hypothetical protein TNCV_4186881 [Trichonephila clavipes]|nr:hypothetical protein TNCV_4186881 [Trichonephila clavipes]